MEADGKGSQENELAAPSAERRSGSERRMSPGRRRAELAGATPGTPATSAPNDLKSIRKFYFRSFESRRSGTDRRACSCEHESGSCQTSPDADDGRLTSDEVASLLQSKG